MCMKISFLVFITPICSSGSIVINRIYGKEIVELFFNNNGLMIQEYLHGQEIGVDYYINIISEQIMSIFSKKKVLMRVWEINKVVF